MPDPRPDLDAYLSRIGLARPPAADLAALGKLQAAHLAAIPFENLDVRLRRPVPLDLASLEARLVRRRRGGYCFEQNSLFAAVLGAFGYTVATLEARVRPPGAPRPLPRTHMVLRVEVERLSYLVDVGFGGDGPLAPVPLGGEPSPQFDGDYRVATEDDGTRVLQRRAVEHWIDLYAFGLAPALPVDYEVAHHYTSTHPRSPFVTGLTVQRSLPEERHFLRGRAYTVRRGREESREELADTRIPALLRETFGLEVGDEEVLRALPPLE